MKNAQTPIHDGADTRTRVARTLLEDGPATAADLAARLHLTPAAVRRHLDHLVAEGHVDGQAKAPFGPTSSESRGRGRPAKYFALTDAGRDAFEQDYDHLAADLLRFLAAEHGPESVEAFARARVAATESRYTEVLADVPAGDRPQALAAALSADGFAASVRPGPAGAGAGEQVCQHHCPVAHVASEFPQLCEAETEMFGRLLGTHVQRLATIAHGDGICTTHVPVQKAEPVEQAAPTAVPKARHTPSERSS